jgi:hypothetical protein
MPDLFTDEYENSKRRWQKAKENLDGALVLYDSIYKLLKEHQKELDEAFRAFSIEQAKIAGKAKKTKINVVKTFLKDE